MADRWNEDQGDGRGRGMGRGQGRRFRGRDPVPRTFNAEEDGRGPVSGERETGADYGDQAFVGARRPPMSQDHDRARIYGEGYFGQEGYAMGEGAFGGSATPLRSPAREAYARAYGVQESRMDRQDDRGLWDRTTDEVASWFGDDDAERRRSRDRDHGHRGRGPKGYVRPDDRISDDVHHHLSDDPWLDASDVEVQVKDGEVTLSGTVDDRRAKHRAEHCVEDIHGVKHVQNNLRVQPRVDQPSITGQPAQMATSSTLAKVTDGET